MRSVRRVRDRAEVAAGVGGGGPYRASDDPDDPRPRFYALDMFPYPSGDLHMGHAEAFSGGDAVARYPGDARATTCCTRSAGTRSGCPPRTPRSSAASTPRSGPTPTSSSRRRRSSGWACRSTGRAASQTCDPEYYRWTQWLFLRFFERGLAYRKNAPVNWCPNDQTVLANEQVIDGRLRALRHDGRAPRPDAVVLQDHRLRAAAAGRHGDARATGRSASSTMQRNWIGRSEGAEVTFTIEETGEEVEVFTTRPDTLWGVTFFVFAAEHPAREQPGRAGRHAGRRSRRWSSRSRSTPLTIARAGRHEGGRAARRPRREPGERRAGAVLRGALRADGVRHRRDHGRARARPARLRVRARSTTCRSAS